MSRYFFDSSALVKRYCPEAGTDEVNRLFADSDATHYISRLAVVEVQRALARRVRTGEIREPELDHLRNLFYNDIGQRLLQVRRFRDFHYHHAVRLVRKYAAPQKTPLLGTLDALHLVSALDLRSNNAVDVFVSADKNLCEAAEAEGLSVRNPTL